MKLSRKCLPVLFATVVTLSVAVAKEEDNTDLLFSLRGDRILGSKNKASDNGGFSKGPCPSNFPKIPSGKKRCIRFEFENEDTGATVEKIEECYGSGNTVDVEVDGQTLELHISCSDTFPGGYGEKGDPQQGSGLRVKDFQIGDSKKCCGRGNPTKPIVPPGPGKPEHCSVCWGKHCYSSKGAPPICGIMNCPAVETCDPEDLCTQCHRKNCYSSSGAARWCEGHDCPSQASCPKKASCHRCFRKGCYSGERTKWCDDWNCPIEPTCDGLHSEDSPDTLTPQPNKPGPCESSVPNNKKRCVRIQFEEENTGAPVETLEKCYGKGNEVDVEVAGQTLSLHISCSDDFTDAYGDKGDPAMGSGLRITESEIYNGKKCCKGGKVQ